MAVKEEKGLVFRRQASVSWFQQKLGLSASCFIECETFVYPKAKVSLVAKRVKHYK